MRGARSALFALHTIACDGRLTTRAARTVGSLQNAGFDVEVCNANSAYALARGGEAALHGGNRLACHGRLTMLALKHHSRACSGRRCKAATPI